MTGKERKVFAVSSWLCDESEVELGLRAVHGAGEEQSRLGRVGGDREDGGFVMTENGFHLEERRCEQSAVYLFKGTDAHVGRRVPLPSRGR